MKNIKEKADAFADKMKLAKAVDEWVPKPFEPVWVWNNSDKKRMKLLFAFFSETTIFAFEQEYEKWSNFTVHEFQNFAKIDAPIIVPMREAMEKIASEYGVPADLIQFQIDK